MIKVAINLGGNGPLNLFPMVFDFENAREWSDSIREESNMIGFLDWAQACNLYPISKMKIWAHIEDGDWYWDFEIKLKNVREFKKYTEMEYEEICSIVEAFRREQKINEILDEDD